MAEADSVISGQGLGQESGAQTAPETAVFDQEPLSSVSRIMIAAIRCYQKTAPFRRSSCRFYPSCSHYAIEAIRRYGAGRGTGMALKRLCRCHPFHPGGYDPVI